MKKKILIVLIVIIAISAFVIYKMYNKPHVNIEDAKSEVVITASDFFDAFSTDEANANATYLDKIVAVSGIITEIEFDEEKAIVSLQTNDDFGTVLCHLSENASQKIEAFKVLDTITLKGICTGFLMDVVVVKCEILK